MGIKFSFSTLIAFNGKEYGSVEEMPLDARQTYERILASVKGPGGAQGAGINIRALSGSKIIFNGTEYESPDKMPPDVRQAYERVMASVDANRNGIPDILEGTASSALPPASAQPSAGVRSPLNLVRIGEATGRASPRSQLAVAGVIIAILLVVIIALVIGLSGGHGPKP